MQSLPSLKSQEIPLDHPDSSNMFRPDPDKPFVATRAAIEMYSAEVILACWKVLRRSADEHDGLDYLQVFESEEVDEDLWFIEDGPGGAITATTSFGLLTLDSCQYEQSPISPCLPNRGYGMHDPLQADRMLVPTVQLTDGDNLK